MSEVSDTVALLGIYGTMMLAMTRRGRYGILPSYMNSPQDDRERSKMAATGSGGW